MTTPSRNWLAVAALSLLLGSGCSTNDSGYAVSGSVTFNGKPIPRGHISFDPDTEKGNSGPGRGAEIVDGKYATALGKGLGGGAYRVKIVGYDGQAATVSGESLAEGKSLFPSYVITEEFPKADTTKDFEVPLKALTPAPGPKKLLDGL